MKALKSQLKQIKLQPRAPVAPAAANPEPPAAEIDFPSAVPGVKPLKPDNRHIPQLPKPRPRPMHGKSHSLLTTDALLTQMSAWFEPAQLPYEHRRPGIASNSLRRLKSGHWPVCGELDLHGLDRHTAHEQLTVFLHRKREQGNCVRIIHGKGLSSRGEPVLPKMVRGWLSQHPDVLAFCETDSHQGGSGAVLVLLRRHHPHGDHHEHDYPRF